MTNRMRLFSIMLGEIGWNVEKENQTNKMITYSMESKSPKGEKLYFTISGSDDLMILEDCIKLAREFDVEKHLEVWYPLRGENGVPPTMKELILDAQAIKDMLIQVSDVANFILTLTSVGVTREIAKFENI